MKIVSWNVNGLKAIVKNRKTTLKGFLDYFNADIICIQETKATRSLVSIDTVICEGYTSYFSFSKLKQGYSGVATFCRKGVTPIAAEEGIIGGQSTTNDSIGCVATVPDFTNEECVALDSEGRAILTEHIVGEDGVNNVVIINVYCPRVDPDVPDRLPLKLNFFTAIKERCNALLKAGRQVIVCGDFNCSREIKDSAAFEDMPTFPRETETRQLLSSFVDTGLVPNTNSNNPILIDSFRFLYPDQKAAYTCWCTRTDSRKLNYGQRIDYIFISLSLKDVLQDCQVLQEETGSDHCPVSCKLNITLSESNCTPSFSTCHYPEFSGKQSKLSTYFEKAAQTKGIKRTKSEQSNSTKKKAKMTNSNQMTMLSLWNPKLKDESTSTVQSPLLIKTQSTIGGACTGASKLSVKWKDVFKAPPTAPLCPGHNEPAILRTVKKIGPNKNRKFYVCSKPDGSKNDPQSRCDFFQWLK